VVCCAYSSYRFCRRLDVGAVIQLIQGFYAPAAGYQLSKREVRTGRIMRTTIGEIFRPDRHAFFAKLALSLLSQPAIKFRPHPFHAEGQEEISEYAEGVAAWLTRKREYGHLPRGI
jgi:hypothetical protein